jgi:hypothetical protein
MWSDALVAVPGTATEAESAPVLGGDVVFHVKHFAGVRLSPDKSVDNALILFHVKQNS